MRSGIIYEGPSSIDGNPIVVIAVATSRNAKTGNMLQTYILRSDMTPSEANQIGADYSICGHCPQKGKPLSDEIQRVEKTKNGKTFTSTPLARGRSCYVVLHQGPTQVYKAYKAGRYVHVDPVAAGYDSVVRVGAYGDPGAVPIDVWQSLLENARAHTGYTRQWRHNPDLRSICHASVSTENEKQMASRRGWQTFRVREPDSVVLADEMICPASREGGNLTNCYSCRICNGAETNKNVTIIAHGQGWRNFKGK